MVLCLYFKSIVLVHKSDVLILGSGIAGLTTAIQLAKLRSDISITVVSKTNIEETNTKYAQGGISAVWNHEIDDFEIL